MQPETSAGAQRGSDPGPLDRRRAILSALAAGASIAGLSGTAAAQSAASGGASSPRSPRRRDPLLLLLQRTTNGYLPEEETLARSLGYEGWLEYQLAPENIDDSAAEALLVNYGTLGMSAKELFDTFGPGSSAVGVPSTQLTGAALVRGSFSKRQLYERMVEFWTDHFNVPNNVIPLTYLKTVEDRDVIRQHAMGRFRDLLQADARSAAMLAYLNNLENVAGAPNENYAREVMELHTLGVDGPYNENDVRELARCFTGWAFYPPPSPQHGDFFFRGIVHDTGEKQVLGLTIPAGGGVQDADTVLDHLAGHPATAQYVSGKLVRWLVGYEPSQALVDEVAATFLATDGDIKEMLRVVLSRTNLEAEDPWSQPKLKRPLHFVCSILRAVGAQMGNPQALIQALQGLGQRPFFWQAPDGYPDDIETWGSSLLSRWQLAWALLADEVPGVFVDPQNLLALINGAPVGESAEALNRSLTGGTMTREEVRGLQAYIDSRGPLNLTLLREAVSLVFSTPSYQFH